MISATQEDIDLLMILEDGTKTHMVFIEAKLFAAWGNKQLRSKLERLKVIFEDVSDDCKNVVPHLCLLSPKKPTRIYSEEWPEWVKPIAHLKGEGDFSKKEKVDGKVVGVSRHKPVPSGWGSPHIGPVAFFK